MGSNKYVRVNFSELRMKMTSSNGSWDMLHFLYSHFSFNRMEIINLVASSPIHKSRRQRMLYDGLRKRTKGEQQKRRVVLCGTSVISYQIHNHPAVIILRIDEHIILTQFLLQSFGLSAAVRIKLLLQDNQSLLLRG